MLLDYIHKTILTRHIKLFFCNCILFSCRSLLFSYPWRDRLDIQLQWHLIYIFVSLLWWILYLKQFWSCKCRPPFWLFTNVASIVDWHRFHKKKLRIRFKYLQITWTHLPIAWTDLQFLIVSYMSCCFNVNKIDIELILVFKHKIVLASKNWIEDNKNDVYNWV